MSDWPFHRGGVGPQDDADAKAARRAGGPSDRRGVLAALPRRTVRRSRAQAGAGAGVNGPRRARPSTLRCSMAAAKMHLVTAIAAAGSAPSRLVVLARTDDADDVTGEAQERESGELLAAGFGERTVRV